MAVSSGFFAVALKVMPFTNDNQLCLFTFVYMKHILLFGAGKSATVLIDYLKEITVELGWQATVVDGNETFLQQKVGSHTNVKARVINVENVAQRNNLVTNADIIISMLPPALHYLVAESCLKFGKHLLTASYLDDKVKAMEKAIKNKGILFLYEMGLDPGIDHMSAVKLIDEVKQVGGKITSFKSHCGGLVAPESDNNPWHYKVSWNPKNIVLAGKAGAIYKEEGKIVRLPYEKLFSTENIIEIPGQILWSYYPNRDSLQYIPLYQLQEADTFIRTTLRHPDFCFGWKNMIDLQLTSEEIQYDTDGMTIAEFFKLHFEKHGFSDWLTQMLTTRLSFAKDLMNDLMQLLEVEKAADENEPGYEEAMMLVNEKGELDTLNVEDIKEKAATAVALKMHEANLSLKQLFFLGLDSNEVINKGKCSAADVIQFVIEKKLALEPHDKDMVVMLHEINYTITGIPHAAYSLLVTEGKDSTHTAMAKTVGLPLGIAARFILQGKINLTGLHIPIHQAIYEPVLEELKKYGIVFKEKAGI